MYESQLRFYDTCDSLNNIKLRLKRHVDGSNKRLAIVLGRRPVEHLVLSGLIHWQVRIVHVGKICERRHVQKIIHAQMIWIKIIRHIHGIDTRHTTIRIR